MARVSVLMPTFEQVSFIGRALDSLCGQTMCDWELVIVDDGSRDGTHRAIKPYLSDRRICYLRLARNVGLGAALNRALDRARAELVAYLPSDDVYYRDHLASLVECLDAAPEAALAYAGVRNRYGTRAAPGQIEGYALQLAQVMHRRTPERWVTRAELVTDDLERMFWTRLRSHGAFVGTGRVTCEWTWHPHQRHRLIQEPDGGINAYRARFGVAQPLRYHSTVGNAIDEVARYQRFNSQPMAPRSADGLKILLVGELAYNPERVLALEERGHTLYGLWMPNPTWFNTVGPLPFGHVADLPRATWRQAARRVRPDVIYALLNWQAVPFAHQVMRENPGVPFVWHFKEGPLICMEKGCWPQLVDLYRGADGRIYSSPELREWYLTAIPGVEDRGLAYVLDGDLPKREWFAGEPAPRLSEADGQIHTVVPGRPIGMHPWVVEALAHQGIHLHFYGDYTHGTWREWIEEVRSRAPGYLHLHPNAGTEAWVSEFSRYDAGWLHLFESQNQGDIRRANWDDLNYPARIATYAAAGLPMLQRDNTGARVAAQSLVRTLDLGLFFTEVDELAAQLRDTERMEQVRRNIQRQREQFTFDVQADRLIAFFRRVIRERSG